MEPIPDRFRDESVCLACRVPEFGHPYPFLDAVVDTRKRYSHQVARYPKRRRLATCCPLPVTQAHTRRKQPPSPPRDLGPHS